MTATTETVVVELMAFGVAKTYSKVTLAEAKELLAKRMAKGHHWHVPTWQFESETADRPETVKQDMARAAYERIAKA